MRDNRRPGDTGLTDWLLTVVRAVPSVLRRTGSRFNADRCPRLAAALSFTTILSLVPLLTVGISVFSMFPGFRELTDTFQDFIYRNFVPAAGDAVAGHLRGFVANAGKLTTLGLAFLVFASLLALSTIEDAFNDIWRVSRGRSLIQRVLVYWAVVSLGPLLIVLSLSISSYLLSLKVIADTQVLEGLLRWFLVVMPLLLAVLAFLLLYVAVPNHDVPLKPALAGACVAALLFEMAKRLFAWYLLAFGNYEAIYGALASIPIFLLWIYLSWVIILFGVELVAAITEYRDSKHPTQPA